MISQENWRQLNECSQASRTFDLVWTEHLRPRLPNDQTVKQSTHRLQ
jgi:hypothetical protein